MVVQCFPLFFALCYSLGIGLFSVPQGLGAALTALAFLFLAERLVRERSRSTRLFNFFLGASVIGSAGLSLATNSLTIHTVVLGTVVTVVWALISHASDRPLVYSGRLYLRYAAEFAIEFMRVLFVGQALPRISFRIPAYVWRGVLLAAPILACFHVLFAIINQRYADAMREAFVLIFDIEFWLYALQTLGIAYLLRSLLMVQIVVPGNDAIQEREARNEGRMATVGLLAGTLLFAIFALFQGQELTKNLSALEFRELSLYVQKGYWELMIAGLLGYVWWLVIKACGDDLSAKLSRERILRVFAMLLALLMVFALHKLGALQAFFGIKDTRLYASFGALLGLGTCFGAALLSLRRSEGVVFRFQIIVAGFFMLLVTLFNVDGVVSRHHSIRYQVDGKFQKDFSYLLTNSYDNYEDWGTLMREGLEGGLEAPGGYYWGRYKPLCVREGGRRKNLLREHHEKLNARVAQQTGGLRAALRTNLREQFAAEWLRVNQGLLSDFYAAVEARCDLASPKVSGSTYEPVFGGRYE